MTAEREAPAATIAPPETGYVLNTARTAAVSTTQFWEEMTSCPRGVKVQLLGKGGVAVYGLYDGRNPFWTHWAPVPKRREENQDG